MIDPALQPVAIAAGCYIIGWVMGGYFGRIEGAKKATAEMYAKQKSTMFHATLIGGAMMLDSLKNINALDINSEDGAIRTFEKDWFQFSEHPENQLNELAKKFDKM